MILKFIGRNGSMDLEHGKKYDVTIKTSFDCICVSWKDESGKMKMCPYSSPQALAANWTRTFRSEKYEKEEGE